MIIVIIGTSVKITVYRNLINSVIHIQIPAVTVCNCSVLVCCCFVCIIVALNYKLAAVNIYTSALKYKITVYGKSVSVEVYCAVAVIKII